MTLAKKLKVLMILHDENNKTLADALNISENTVSNIMHGKHNARHDTLQKISKHYDVPMDFLLNGNIVLSSKEWAEVIK